jgi:uncharacterized DUF497 family protein
MTALFEWDPIKDDENKRKHGSTEKRYFCFGKVGDGVITVRFVIRNQTVRIIGAGYWRKGKRVYEAKNRLYG